VAEPHLAVAEPHLAVAEPRLVIARSEATTQSLDRFAALAMTGKTHDNRKNSRDPGSAKHLAVAEAHIDVAEPHLAVAEPHLVIARSDATTQSLDRFAALAMTGKTHHNRKNSL
jgi:hypothetical protein